MRTIGVAVLAAVGMVAVGLGNLLPVEIHEKGSEDEFSHHQRHHVRLRQEQESARELGTLMISEDDFRERFDNSGAGVKL